MKQGLLTLTQRTLIFVLTCILMAVCSLFPACKHGINPKEESRRTIYLDARSNWINTGLLVRKGQKVGFECRGTWAVASENESRRWPDTGPEGHGKHPGEKVHSRGDSKKELPGVPFGTLLGKVDGVVFPIGDQKEVVMPSGGYLYLVINDYPFYRHDNRGGLNITILVTGNNQ